MYIHSGAAFWLKVCIVRFSMQAELLHVTDVLNTVNENSSINQTHPRKKLRQSHNHIFFNFKSAESCVLVSVVKEGCLY